MNGIAPRAQATIAALINELGTENLPYVIARNYENYPDFGHDLDLFFSDNHVSEFNAIARKIAADYNWDYLTLCDHWNTSKIRTHNIEVFRFYKINPVEYLQLDLFHGFLVWGVPLVNSKEIINTRVRDVSNRFYHMRPALENSLRMLQISKLMSYEGTTEKIQRYRTCVLLSLANHECDLVTYSAKLFSSDTSQALDYLKSGKMQAFRISMNRIKQRFFLKSMIAKPYTTIMFLRERFNEYWRLFYSAPCGFILRVYVPSEEKYRHINQSLDFLVKKKVLSCWSDNNCKTKKFGVQHRRIMERGGIVVKRVGSADKAMLNLENCGKDQTLSAILDLIVKRHTLLQIGEEIK